MQLDIVVKPFIDFFAYVLQRPTAGHSMRYFMST